MAVITTKELAALDDILSQEMNVISKLKSYAESTTDQVLKTKYEQTAQKHQKHFDTLYSLLK